MSPKELMYIEDALGHEKQMRTSCADFAQKLTDSDLKSFVQALCERHGETYDGFYRLLK